MKTYFYLACAVTLLCSFDGCAIVSSIAVQRGRSDARADLHAGNLATESFGKPAHYRPVYHRLLKDRYGVDSRVVAGCGVDNRIIGHASGYNEVMCAEIRRRFGKDVFERTAADAKRIYFNNHQ